AGAAERALRLARDVVSLRRGQVAFAAAAIAVALGLPRVLYPVLALDILVWGLFAMSIDLLLGFGGLLSFGHAAYWGVAGYAAGLVARDAGMPFPAAYRIVHSPFGHVLVSIRDNEARARALGYDTARYKLIAFVLSAALAGLAGSIEALSQRFVSLDFLHWSTSGQVVLMAVLGGLG